MTTKGPLRLMMELWYDVYCMALENSYNNPPKTKKGAKWTPGDEANLALSDFRAAFPTVQNANNLSVSGEPCCDRGDEEADGTDDEPPFSVDETADE
jgi:hypothetical protein